MAAVGPPQQQVRMAHQQVWAALEVALRVPCLYIIDAIFNSYYDSSQSRFCLGLQIFLRLLVLSKMHKSFNISVLRVDYAFQDLLEEKDLSS
ncbi:PREDICTED: E3 ubiquitin-protein ligase RNF139 isoform X4 [Hipposideros armiger]|uniref:E3 ubiquitin-protein ligase RNF139 isoform X4 n=1 Tax=Hipposideros armiger TaxID=186990 RepID=A0A8B7RHR4_HIPAR|nr:PREDICTED: E3 ubiquitin-protein ligase RNF139 isoform X4 [Hipposideros armiger]